MLTNNLMHINSYNIGIKNSTNDYQRLYINDLVGKKLTKGFAKVQLVNYIYCKYTNKNEFMDHIEENYNFFITSNNGGIIVENDYIIDIAVTSENSSFVTYYVSILSISKAECQNKLNNLVFGLKDFLDVSNKVSYETIQYRDNQSLDSYYYSENIYKDFNPLFFPYISDCDEYINSFIESNSSLLILKGIPGTGKTTFSKQIITKLHEQRVDNSSLNVLYSFDENILFSNEFFTKLQFGTIDVVVLEDFNSSIHKNQESENVNTLNKFLSLIEGLISNNIKIIISTNIESENQLNSALIRPGRCFDVLNFRKLEKVEIDNLCDSCAKDLDLQVESINLSEFYARVNNEQNINCSVNSLGFKK
ncbi:MAG: AAA family ATPase [Poseidonibacter sp.]|uniref:AAA family ATPase n=1 Tax=Poseidonibacter sp. TaxID=2321188 RepID=UPI00359E3122